MIEHHPGCCRECGADLIDGEPLGVARRQVRDIPTVRPLVVEHRLHRRRCGCGAGHRRRRSGSGVAGPVQYGPNCAAFAVYLMVVCAVKRRVVVWR